MTNKILLFALIFSLGLLMACGDSSTGTNPDPNDNDEAVTYGISVDMNPLDAGSISDLEDSYEEGEEIEVQANPNNEYVFTEWTGDMESPDNPLSVTMDQDYDLTANFELKEYELIIATDGEGTVQEEVLEQKSKEYEHGTVVELTASPAEGYKFVEWTGDVEGTENPAQITVDDPKEVTAVFEKKSYPLTLNTDGDGAVSEEVIQQKTTDYEHGTVVELTANPAEGSDFAGWRGDVSGTENPVEVTVEDTMEVTATFEKKTFTVSTSTIGNGTLEKTPDQQEYEYDSTVKITATPDEGWAFSEWGGDASGSDNPLTVTVTENLDITATFEEKSTFSLLTNTSGEGSIAKDPDQQEYPEDTEVELIANPDEGWQFVEWQGDLSGTQNPQQLTVDSDKEVTALFKEQSVLKNKIVFVSDEVDAIEELFVVNPDGSNLTQLTFESESDKWAPAVSPDGSQIVYTSRGDIFFMQADGSNVTSFPYEGDEPNWSPDGTQITFTSQMNGGKSVYVADIDGSNLVRITDSDTWFDSDPYWSPNGNKIVFSRGKRFEDINIFTVNVDGTGLTQLTEDDGDNSEPVWSPGGTKIAFVTDRHGYYDELYMMDADGSNAERLTSNSEIDSDPSWSPDGSEIVFSSKPTGDYQLFKIDIDTEEITEVTQAVNDSDHGYPSWSPAN